MRSSMLVRMVLISCLLIVTACSRSVATDISERDSAEITVALRSQGIASSRSLNDSKKWVVSVDSSDWSDAMMIMSSAGLPRADVQGYAELLKKDSMIASPSTEKAKLLWAASNELARSLLDIDGVVSARVHLVIPDKDPFREKPRNSSASVLIKHSPEIKPVDLEPAIRSFVSRSAEGLSPEAVSVTFVAARPFALSREPGASGGLLKRFSSASAGIVGVIVLGIFAWLVVSRQRKAKPEH
jgi:type III secretion protein J